MSNICRTIHTPTVANCLITKVTNIRCTNTNMIYLSINLHVALDDN